MSMLLAMLSFSFAMSISPGPVNAVILSSGANYGVRKTSAYISGATLGFALLLLAIGFILEQFIRTFPDFLVYLSVVGAGYILYIGYKMAASTTEVCVKKTQPPKFYQGFLLQWLNPKAWVACVSGVSLFSNTESMTPLLVFTLIYFIVCYACLFAWAVLGDKIAYLLNNQFRMRLFNFMTGGLLMLTAVYFLLA